MTTIGATRIPDPRIPGLAPVFPGKFRGGEFALRTSGNSRLAPNPRPRQKMDTKPKPGDFSIGLLLYFLFPTSTGFIFVVVSVQFSYENSETFSTIFLCPFSISRIVNAKKSRNSRGKSRAMETHFYPVELSLDFSYENSETFSTIFFYALLVFLE